MKTIVENERWEGNCVFKHKVANQNYTNISYRGIVVRHANFKDCRFEKCEFKNCYLGFYTHYKDCSWIKCKFYGKYSGLGDSATFEDCIFEDIQIIGLDSLKGVSLINCSISGKLKNIILYGPGDSSPTSFDQCDLSGSLFENVNFYNGVDLSTVTLPGKGIRTFHNNKGEFTKSLRTASQQLDKHTGSSLNALSTPGQQNPVIFDLPLLDEMLDTEKARLEFEQIARKYEIT